MPIVLPHPLIDLEPAQFDERDRVVMGCAFEAQNALGRLCGEHVYENELARRLLERGFSSVMTQVPVEISVGSFHRVLRMDLVADHALYEIKATDGLTKKHEAQVLQYAVLNQIRHGKLLNFGTERVEGRLRVNAAHAAVRTSPEVDDRLWRETSTADKNFASY